MKDDLKIKKVINGKMYNTETAKRIAAQWNGLSVTDGHNVYEELFLKKTGEFFLAGEGGALSDYRTEIGRNCWTSGKKIVPLSIEEAKGWIEEHANSKYEEVFGEIEE